MPNTYFKFKQFKIEQADTAMKVTTEGCVLGAWVDPAMAPLRVLDIGTGTGLLALMLAQKFPNAQIDAVELERAAYQQAMQNFSASPWAERLRAFHKPIQQFIADEMYDLIITNPPFFNRSLLSPKTTVNHARHDAGLLQTDLISAISRLLHRDGSAYVLYPHREATGFARIAAKEGFSIKSTLNVYNRSGGQILRVINQFTGKSVPSAPQPDSLIIKDESGNYTEDFVRLLKPYYLHL